ncbi:MAG: nucleoside-diphosphate kinase [candidate division KSB1 bacterium]|nr:nucleoside-diphosphate kinase [candidate division KSB1 bacterium]
MKERTLALIKPDAYAARNCGKIITVIEESDLDIIGIRTLTLSSEQARSFYAVHKEKPFFEELISYMTSGPIFAMALEGEKAIEKWRNMMGATNPAKAEEGTIRNRFGTDLTHNATHGSDAPETAKVEVDFFFKDEDFNR